MIDGFAVTRGFDYRSNFGITGGYTRVHSPSTVLDVRVSGARFGEYRDPAQTFDPATLQFSSTALQLMRGYEYLPLMTIGSFSTTNANSTIASLGSQRSDWNGGFDRPMTTLSIAPTVTKIWGDHSIRTGYDYRAQTWTITNEGFLAGRYAFNGAYTRANNSAGLNDRAQSFAQFLLGLPTAGTTAVATANTAVASQFEIASPGEFRQSYHGLFLQDDWRATRRLTLNLGVRLEINAGMSESEDRNLGGFDTTSSSPIENAARQAYALNPIPQIAPADFHVRGGVLFADGPVNNTATKVLPRGAFAYLLDDRTVIRGGVGLFSYDYFFENINQAGFSQPTPVTVTDDSGVTFNGATLTNPIPSGQLVQPVGAANGLSSQLGLALGTMYQPDRTTPYYTRWEINLQRDLGRGFVTGFTYLGSRGSNLPVTHQVNNIPMSYLSTSRTRDVANETLLTQNVPSPFTGLLPGSTINGANVQRQQLLRPYPHFLAFGTEEYNGSDRYNAVSLQLEKRFSSGNSFTVQYTHSSLRDELNYLNPADGVLEDRISPNDRPNRLSIGTSLRLPFGRGQHWGKDWSSGLDALAGGWQLSGTYQYQSGFPLAFGSVYYDSACDPLTLKSNIGEKVAGGTAGLDVPGWDTSCFYFHDAPVQTNGVDDPVKQRADPRIQLGNNVRYFPSTLPHLRSDNLHLFDFGLYKNFELPRKMRLQVRFEVINALNYTVLWNPGTDPRATNGLFGIVNQDRNNPRDIQIGVRVTF